LEFIMNFRSGLKRVVKWGVALSPLLAVGVSYALPAADNTTVTTAFTSGAVSAGVVVTGVIGVGGTMTALGLVYSWLKR
jgi:hypothetical protein